MCVCMCVCVCARARVFCTYGGAEEDMKAEPVFIIINIYNKYIYKEAHMEATRKMMRKAERTGMMEAVSAATMLRRLRSRPKRRSTRNARRTCKALYTSYISIYVYIIDTEGRSRPSGGSGFGLVRCSLRGLCGARFGVCAALASGLTPLKGSAARLPLL